MAQEEKELLFKDLSARLPYGVICQIYDHQQDYGEDIFDARLIHIDAWTSHCYFWGCSETDPYKIEQVKPYLRPMSSMTKKETKELFKEIGFEFTCNTCGIPEHYIYEFAEQIKGIPTITNVEFIKVIDFLNAHHFDYRGLIEKGLAIEINKSNNPYKE